MKGRRAHGRRVALAWALMLAAVAGPALAGRDRWTPFGPDGSGFTALTVDPEDPQTLYAATRGQYLGQNGQEGVVVTHDGGASWRAAESGIAGQRVVAIAVDPGHPSRVFALSSYPGESSPIPGVLRSDDGGATWTQLTGAPGFLFSYSLLVLPDAVLVGTDQAIWRSSDGGATWNKVFSDFSSVQFHTLAADPQDPRVVYAANLDYRLKSADGGLSWSELPDPSHNGFHPFINAFAVAPSEPATLYETGGGGGGNNATFRSRDGGATWEGPFGFGATTLLVDPRDPRTLYAGRLDGLYRSRDGAATWERLRAGLPQLSIGETAFYSIHALVADRDGAILAATDQGLVRSGDSGLHWRLAAARGLHHNPVTVLLEDPFEAAHWIVRSFDVYLDTPDGGRSFAPTAPALATQQVSALAFDPFTPRRLLAVTLQVQEAEPAADLLESRDGGATWVPTGAHPPIDTFALALLTRRVWLAAGSEGTVYRTGDGGSTWRPVLQPAFPDENSYFSPTGLLADPRRPGVVWALGTHDVIHGGSTPEIYRTVDYGRTWSPWAIGFSVLLPDPRHTGAAWLAGFSTVARTLDDGTTFETVGHIGGVRITSLVLDRAHPGGLAAGTGEGGAFHSLDGGATWTPLDAGLPNGAHTGFNILAPDGAHPARLWAALGSGGLWRGDFALP